ncbi:lytic transglycosylase domain-containing protein [Flavilitoribacter nigricans]|nr:lytic transglycosylase domain-containing protein [Flavilitoribacter nigricans]
MKLPHYTFYTLFILFVGLVAAQPAWANDTDPEDEIPEYNEEEVKKRLEYLSQDLVEVKYVTAVKGYIKGYVLRNRKHSEIVLGRSIQYFPIFEHYLEKHQLPEALKYLPIVESALDPKAMSWVGAGGLWQFMPATGKERGLDINKYVDERYDPIKSTEAAMVHLRRQYDRFDDWALALAAYNSGSGRVSRAIKRARSKNFWRLMRYLPRETRNYVPAFIAATYLVDYFESHNLKPEYPELDLQITETIRVYDNHSFYRIAQVTDLPLDIIEALNPSYKKGYIPSSREGHYLTLPIRVMEAFKAYVAASRPDSKQFMPVFSGPVYFTRPSNQAKPSYIKSTYVVIEGETLRSIASDLKVSVHQIKAWNKLKSSELIPGQELIVFTPEKFKRLIDREETMSILAPIAVSSLKELDGYGFRSYIPKGDQLGHFFYFPIPEKMRPDELAAYLRQEDAEAFKQLNGLEKNKKLKQGTWVKVNR